MADKKRFLNWGQAPDPLLLQTTHVSNAYRQKCQQHQPTRNAVFRNDGVCTHNLVLRPDCSTRMDGVVWDFRLTVSSDHPLHTNYRVYHWCHPVRWISGLMSYCFWKSRSTGPGNRTGWKNCDETFLSLEFLKVKILGGNGWILTIFAHWGSFCICKTLEQIERDIIKRFLTRLLHEIPNEKEHTYSLYDWWQPL